MSSISNIRPKPKTLGGVLRLLANQADEGEITNLLLAYTEEEEDGTILPGTLVIGPPFGIAGLMWIMEEEVAKRMKKELEG